MSATPRQVVVRVGRGRLAGELPQRPRVAIVGLCPWDHPSLSGAYADFKVKDTQNPQLGAIVEHLRLTRGVDLSALPGLDADRPTALRDAVRLAFSIGVPTVDVIAARTRELQPWDLFQASAVDLIEPFLADIPGVPVALPDAGGPPSLDGSGPAPVLRLEAMMRTMRRFGPVFARNYQVGFVDLPDGTPDDVRELLRRLPQTDVALVAWEGTGEALYRHGWRSGAALVAAILGRRSDPTEALKGGRYALGDGRHARFPRLRELGQDAPASTIDDAIADDVVRLSLSPTGDSVRVLSEPVLRPPVGHWTVPMMWTTKLLHHRIHLAADYFVFRHTTEAEALALQTALMMAVQDFVEAGVVGGPDDADQPVIVAAPRRSSTQPALVAVVQLYLRPWLRSMQIDVSVRPGEPPRLEIT